MKKYIGYFVAISIFCAACGSLTQDIEIDLPDYDNQLAVESFLIPGQPLTVLLTQSESYFAPFTIENDQFLENILIDEADVRITFDGTTHTLENQLFFNPFTEKLANYIAPSVIVPDDFDGVFELEVIAKDGRTASATTTLPIPIPIDSVQVEWAENDTLARVLAYFQDIPNEENYFRRLLTGGEQDTVVLDFVFDDSFNDNTQLVAGTAYDYVVGDTMQHVIYHITEDFFNYMTSIYAAVGSNGNPFAQPSTILSNVEGESDPIGIFTGMNIEAARVIIER
ncbi:MAG: DUF4249 domain-containing protein [Bacteroidota bacterium]